MELKFEDIFEPFERLLRIEICGKEFFVPENNYLLRCFQYLSLEKVSMGEFCWNGSCANCQVWLVTESGEKPILSCRTKVEEGMRVSKLSKQIASGLFEE
ncbi:MAG: 2Fe-2S iron-sulfur cluster-binding protein [Pyrinomonadaceae bacterium]|nr:2Fe-2S iron-sulfur cluster-binding protein [Pyrinomonadaceae bacterium]MCX7639030.1 2Fe-2S iron-sulfur cluster-binding protein [Pyrinomonadaceae bacterium]MDW8303749.1 2Fe-2S iron-sulfur cluster-binding protein [Acidobacteriota bacterium]